MRTVLLTLFAAVVAFAATPRAIATDRFYPDLEASSPNGRFTLTAVSPDNAGGRMPFARNFVFTMTDSQTDEVVWLREQPLREPSPRRISVHHDGWVGIWTAFDTVIILEKGTANRLVEHRLFDSFSEEEMDRHVWDTTAGYMWAQFAMWCWIDYDGRPHFVTRPFWARRVVVDAQHGLVIDDAAGELLEACRAFENRVVIDTLDRIDPNDIDMEDAADRRSLRDLTRTVIVAGQNGVVEAVEHLWHIEAAGDPSVPDLVVHPDLSTITRRPSVALNELRFAAQMSLRLLGEEPSELRATYLLVRVNGRLARTIAPVPTGDRNAANGSIEQGMAITTMIKNLGLPDCEDFGDYYEYHLTPEGEDPVSVRVEVDTWHGLVKGVEVRKAIWLDGAAWVELLRL